MKAVIEVGAENFKADVLESPLPVVVDFWAEWCGPCKRLAPLLEEVAAEQAGRVRFAKVNVDEHPELAARFDIRSIPTLLYFAGGEVRQRVIGAVDKKTIVANLPARVPA